MGSSTISQPRSVKLSAGYYAFIRYNLRNVINDLNCTRQFHVEFFYSDIDSCKFLEALTKSTANKKIQKNGNFVAFINDPIFEYFNIPNTMHLSPVLSAAIPVTRTGLIDLTDLRES